jgi:hypothetical protein
LSSVASNVDIFIRKLVRFAKYDLFFAELPKTAT